MYRFSVDYFDWNRLHEKQRRENTIPAMVKESTPKLKDVLPDIGMFLGAIATVVMLMYAVFWLISINKPGRDRK